MRLDNIKDETGLHFVRRPSKSTHSRLVSRVETRKNLGVNHPLDQLDYEGKGSRWSPIALRNRLCATKPASAATRSTHAVYFSVKFRAEVLKSWYLGRNLYRKQKNHCIRVWYASPRSKQNKSIYRAIDMLIGAQFSPWSLIPHENYRGVRLAREAPLE